MDSCQKARLLDLCIVEHPDDDRRPVPVHGPGDDLAVRTQELVADSPRSTRDVTVHSAPTTKKPRQFCWEGETLPGLQVVVRVRSRLPSRNLVLRRGVF